MKIALSVIAAGVIILVFGIIFHLQGQGVVGPEQSFMYTNPDWITYGLKIAVLGILVICAGIGIRFYRSKKR